MARKIGPKKFRLCVNMYRLNQYFPDRIFKYEGVMQRIKDGKKGLVDGVPSLSTWLQGIIR